MENLLGLGRVPKRNKYFQEFPVVLNAFQPKQIHRHGLASMSPKQFKLSPGSRISEITLPKISPKAGKFSISITKQSLFFVKTNKLSVKTKRYNLQHKDVTRQRREIALSTDMNEDMYEEMQ